MQFEQSDILIKLSDGYIENILVYNDEGNYDNGEIEKYYSIVKIIFSDRSIRTVTLSHEDFYPTNEITFAKMLLNNQWIFNNMTLDEFAKFVDDVNEQKTDTAKNFRDTLIAMKPRYS
jgi:hypothetical protein